MSSEHSWAKVSSVGSLDRLARSTVSLDVPEARICREAREQSRKDMHTLNEKLAAQLEKMRILSEQNKKLMHENGGRLSKETEKMRQMYNTELRQLRQLVDDCEREKADSLAKLAGLQQSLRAKQDQITQLQQNIQRLSSQLDQALKDGSAKDADKTLLQRHIQSAEEELQRWRKEAEQAKKAADMIRKNLDEETANRMACQSEMQTLREEMEFLRRVHEQEMEELRAMATADQEQDRDQWRLELQKAIRDIKSEYDSRLDRIRDEMEASYASRLEEIGKMDANQRAQFLHLQEENAQLRNTLDSMRGREDKFRSKCEQLERSLNDALDECSKLRKQLDDLMNDSTRDRQAAEDALNKAHRELSALTDAKLNLEAEIAAYSRLLDAQDSLISGVKSQDSKKALNSVPSYRSNDNHTRHSSYSTPHHVEMNRSSQKSAVKRWVEREEPSGQSTRSHFTERTVEDYAKHSPGSQQLSCSYSDIEKQSSASHNELYTRGHLVINECAHNGSYIEIANKGNAEESLNGWSMIRNLDHGRQIIRYTFPNHTIPAQSSFKIWAGGKPARSSTLRDLEAPYSNWGTGAYINTSLYNPEGQEKATHIQHLQCSP